MKDQKSDNNKLNAGYRKLNANKKNLFQQNEEKQSNDEYLQNKAKYYKRPVKINSEIKEESIPQYYSKTSNSNLVPSPVVYREPYSNSNVNIVQYRIPAPAVKTEVANEVGKSKVVKYNSGLNPSPIASTYREPLATSSVKNEYRTPAVASKVNKKIEYNTGKVSSSSTLSSNINEAFVYRIPKPRVSSISGTITKYNAQPTPMITSYRQPKQQYSPKVIINEYRMPKASSSSLLTEYNNVIYREPLKMASYNNAIEINNEGNLDDNNNDFDVALFTPVGEETTVATDKSISTVSSSTTPKASKSDKEGNTESSYLDSNNNGIDVISFDRVGKTSKSLKTDKGVEQSNIDVISFDKVGKTSKSVKTDKGTKQSNISEEMIIVTSPTTSNYGSFSWKTSSSIRGGSLTTKSGKKGSIASQASNGSKISKSKKYSYSGSKSKKGSKGKGKGKGGSTKSSGSDDYVTRSESSSSDSGSADYLNINFPNIDSSSSSISLNDPTLIINLPSLSDTTGIPINQKIISCKQNNTTTPTYDNINDVDVEFLYELLYTTTNDNAIIVQDVLPIVEESIAYGISPTLLQCNTNNTDSRKLQTDYNNDADGIQIVGTSQHPIDTVMGSCEHLVANNNSTSSSLSTCYKINGRMTGYYNVQNNNENNNDAFYDTIVQEDMLSLIRQGMISNAFIPDGFSYELYYIGSPTSASPTTPIEVIGSSTSNNNKTVALAGIGIFMIVFTGLGTIAIVVLAIIRNRRKKLENSNDNKKFINLNDENDDYAYNDYDCCHDTDIDVYDNNTATDTSTELHSSRGVYYIDDEFTVPVQIHSNNDDTKNNQILDLNRITSTSSPVINEANHNAIKKQKQLEQTYNKQRNSKNHNSNIDVHTCTSLTCGAGCIMNKVQHDSDNKANTTTFVKIPNVRTYQSHDTIEL